MYIRFQTALIDEFSTKPQWIFQNIYQFRDSGVLQDYEKDYLQWLLTWFDENLEKSHTFSRKRTSSEATRWLSRYKESAHDHISKMYELKAFLEIHDMYVEVVMTDIPGYIIYEYDIQIVAEPYK